MWSPALVRVRKRRINEIDRVASINNFPHPLAVSESTTNAVA
jgi:hypothetical protein